MTLSLKNNNILKFNSSTLEDVRREFNLDKAGAMDQAMDTLQDWIQKQDHFVKKDLKRDYLERFIISSKGSVEKAKTRIDKLCTMRTLVPHIFEKTHAIRDCPIREFYLGTPLPILTTDGCRIYVGKIKGNIFPSALLKDVLEHSWIICEYLRLHDYCKGYQVIYDFTDANLMQVNVDWMLFRHTVTLLLEAYGFRIMSIYIIASSKVIHTLINVAKQFLSAKIADKFRVLKSPHELHDFFPRKVLPQDYGGEQKCILDLFDDLNKECITENHLAHIEEMKKAVTNEKLRSTQSYDKDYLGMPGSFKMLNID